MPTPPGPGYLEVQVRPEGATILINGVAQQATTPARLALPPGSYQVIVEKSGYERLGRGVDVTSGQMTRISAVLRALTTPIPLVAPAVSSPTMASQPTATPPRTPTASSPMPSVTPSPLVTVREETLTLSVYPYQAYLRAGVDAKTGMTYQTLDRAAYEASRPTPGPKAFKAIVLENEFLKMTILPELGGRIYQVIFRPTGQTLFYNNPVVKPSRWGPWSSDQNWWLAAGGIEWAFPTAEHGYVWGTPWSYTLARQPDAVSVILRDSAASNRLRAQVTITLRAGEASFSVQPRIENQTQQTVAFQFWVNALLTLGAPTMSANTDFSFPTSTVQVHSTGDATLPAARQMFSWPVYQGRDLSRYSAWRTYLGLFAAPSERAFVGAYNRETGLGVVRVFPRQTVPGVKLFAFGPEFSDRTQYTDDNSQYFELWGGPQRTFWPEDDATLPAGGALEWTERWMPVGAIGGLSYANARAALYLAAPGGSIVMGVTTTRAESATIVLLLDGREVFRRAATISPAAPFMASLAVPADAHASGRAVLRLDQAGGVIAEYEAALTLR